MYVGITATTAENQAFLSISNFSNVTYQIYMHNIYNIHRTCTWHMAQVFAP